MNEAAATARQDPALAEVEILGLAADSRQVRPGYLFAALAGSKTDGRRFIAEAVKRGAAALLAEPGVGTEGAVVPLVSDPNPRRRLALMAARFYGRQPRTIAAVTGTNGKTSTTCFTRQLWAGLGLKAASMGTLGILAPGFERSSSLTTPDPVALHQDLAALASAGVDHLALEASSHGLDQYRLDGVAIAIAAFTNLSRDHLDYHPTMAAYFSAKRRLFAEVMPPGGVAVLNADVPEYEPLLEICRERRHRVLSYGQHGKELRLEEVRPFAAGQEVRFALDGRPHAATLPLVGAFQARNMLAALGLVLAAGGAPEAAVAAIGSIQGVAGRMQRVACLANGAAVFVDYAHKPGALESVLAALRPHTERRLVVVFGCGGDRDAGKRPQMGAIAARLADWVIVTDDNPRGEDAAAIRRAVLAGCPGATEIGSRGEAIETAMRGLAGGDVLVIAGKGHERYQIVGGETLPFDDTEVAREVAAALGGRAE